MESSDLQIQTLETIHYIFPLTERIIIHEKESIYSQMIVTKWLGLFEYVVLQLPKSRVCEYIWQRRLDHNFLDDAFEPMPKESYDG